MTPHEPPPIFTPEYLDTLRRQADLPDDVWYLVVATALCILNRPEDIQAVYTHAVGAGHAQVGVPNGATQPDMEQQRIARRIREALLKVSAIGGLPKVRPFLQPVTAPPLCTAEPEPSFPTIPSSSRYQRRHPLTERNPPPFLT